MNALLLQRWSKETFEYWKEEVHKYEPDANGLKVRLPPPVVVFQIFHLLHSRRVLPHSIGMFIGLLVRC
jgi:hypothetical protein